MYAATGTLYKKYEEGDLRRDRSIAPFTYHSVEDPENPGNLCHHQVVRLAGAYLETISGEISSAKRKY